MHRVQSLLSKINEVLFCYGPRLLAAARLVLVQADIGRHDFQAI